MEKKFKIVKIIFGIRAALWCVAIGATAYWIKWSFKIYEMGFKDEGEYALHFRPIFVKGLAISLIAIGICYILRFISDKIKKDIKSSL